MSYHDRYFIIELDRPADVSHVGLVVPFLSRRIGPLLGTHGSAFLYVGIVRKQNGGYNDCINVQTPISHLVMNYSRLETLRSALWRCPNQWLHVYTRYTHFYTNINTFNIYSDIHEARSGVETKIEYFRRIFWPRLWPRPFAARVYESGRTWRIWQNY